MRGKSILRVALLQKRIEDGGGLDEMSEMSSGRTRNLPFFLVSREEITRMHYEKRNHISNQR